MSLVLDSSVALAWLYTDETTASVNAVFDKISRGGAIVPGLWHLEVANSLLIAVRRKRIDKEFRNKSLADLSLLNISIDPEMSRFAWTTTLHLADRYGLTVYDAAYLELAQRNNLPLASLDQDLRTAAGTLGLTLLGM